ncbi:MAG: hypothetical protein IT204_26005 [Fimbriimonadaceae bacterium]|nr:hypothetical protein [Fimbriimonadaceae bacterium]
MIWLPALLALAPPADPAAYALYDGQGRPASFAQLLDAMAAAETACGLLRISRLGLEDGGAERPGRPAPHGPAAKQGSGLLVLKWS